MKNSRLLCAVLAAAVGTAVAQNSSSSSSTAAVSSSAPSNAAGFNTDASANPGDNPLIPTTISPSCQAFLARLNTNSQISTCTSPLIDATNLFASGAVKDGAEDGKQVDAALDGLCGFNKAQGCSDLLVRQVLVHFAGNCTKELKAGQPEVTGTYDVLYALNPFKKAICSKDEATKAYCLTTIASAAADSSTGVPSSASDVNSTASSAKAVSNVAEDGASPGQSFAGMLQAAKDQITLAAAGQIPKRSLFGRGNGDDLPAIFNATASAGANSTATPSNNATTTAATPSTSPNSTAPSTQQQQHAPSLLPNSTTYLTTSLPFLFLSPSFLASDTLCSNCTIDVLSSYISFEQSLPYAAGNGLSDSGLLKGQITLWQGLGEKCGTAFLGEVQKVAGQRAATSGAAVSSVAGVGVAASVVIALSVLFALA